MLNVVKRMGALIASHLLRRAHAVPILEKLGLESLDILRENHVLKIVNSIQRNCHPALRGLFTLDTDGRLINDSTSRIKIGQKRFSVVGAEIYNKKFFSDWNLEHMKDWKKAGESDSA